MCKNGVLLQTEKQKGPTSIGVFIPKGYLTAAGSVSPNIDLSFFRLHDGVPFFFSTFLPSHTPPRPHNRHSEALHEKYFRAYVLYQLFCVHLQTENYRFLRNEKTRKHMKRTSLALFLTLTACTLCAQQETQQTFTRNVLLEQFTTVNCGWCPPGADRITEAISSLNYVIWIKHHAGFGTDFLTNDIHTAMTVFYGGSTFAPAMMVDRTRFDSEDDGPVTSVGQTSAIRGLIVRARQVDSYCKVYDPEISFDASSRLLTGSVSGRFGEDNAWDENTRLTIYLIEDSIVGEQHDYTDHGNWSNYIHMGTVRAAITNMWGDPIEANVDPSDRTFSYSFSYTLPENYNYHHCKVVAFMYQYDPTDINNRPVLNAKQSDYLDKSLGIAEADQGCAMRLFPNPAENRVVLESDEAIDAVSIVNSLGQKVYDQPAGSRRQVAVDTRNLARGIYMVNIRTSRGNASRKLSIVK